MILHASSVPQFEAMVPKPYAASPSGTTCMAPMLIHYACSRRQDCLLEDLSGQDEVIRGTDGGKQNILWCTQIMFK